MGNSVSKKKKLNKKKTNKSYQKINLRSAKMSPCKMSVRANVFWSKIIFMQNYHRANLSPHAN